MAQEVISDPAVRAVMTSQLRVFTPRAGRFAQRQRRQARSQGTSAERDCRRRRRPHPRLEVGLLCSARATSRASRSGPDVLQIGRFSHPPVLEDLAALTVDEDDFDVRSCRVGDCGIRLPAAAIKQIGQARSMSRRRTHRRAARRCSNSSCSTKWRPTWPAPDRFAQYDDGPQPIRPRDEFEAILAGMPEIAALMPGLPDHLRRFSTAPLPDAEDFLYWSKEKFGIAPFITVTHVTIVCPSAATCLMTTRDVYASRYLDASHRAGDCDRCRRTRTPSISSTTTVRAPMR